MCKEKLENFLDIMHLGFILIDKHYNVVKTNDNMLNYLNYKNFMDVNVNLENIVGNINNLMGAIKNNKKSFVYNFQKNSVEKTLYVIKDKKSVYLVFNIQYDKVIENISNQCHDMRNYLNTIDGLNQIALMSDDEKETKTNLELSTQYMSKVFESIQNFTNAIK